MAARKNDGNNFKAVIEGQITDLKNSEATTRKLLSLLSRELLEYVPADGDIGMVNRLLASVNHTTRNYCILFFSEFLEWNLGQNDAKEPVFTDKKTGKKVVAKIMAARLMFLAQASNDIWTWTKENTRGPQRKMDYAKRIANAVSAALNADDAEIKLTPMQVIAAIRDGGLSVHDIIESAEVMAKEVEAAEADAPNYEESEEGTTIDGEATEVVEPEQVEAKENAAPKRIAAPRKTRKTAKAA